MTDTPKNPLDSAPGRDSTPAERAAWIAETMSRLEWPTWPESAEARRTLAERWGVAESTVKGYAWQAARLFRIDNSDERDQLRTELAVRLSKIADRALAERNTVTSLPDFQSAIKAIDLMGKYLWLEPPTRLEHAGSVSLDSIDDLRKRIGATVEHLRVDDAGGADEHDEDDLAAPPKRATT